MRTSRLRTGSGLPGQPALQAHLSNVIGVRPGSDLNVNEKCLFFVACHEGRLAALPVCRR